MNKILSFLKDKIEYIENQKITFLNIFVSVYIASIFRAFLEGYTNTLNLGRPTNFIDSFFHYPFWFIGVFLSVCIVLSLITGEKIQKVSKLFVYFSFIIITPVLFDLIFGFRDPYFFISGNSSDLLKSFFSFVSLGEVVAPRGVQIEVVLVLIVVSIYGYIKTKSLKKVILSVFLTYSVVFLFAITPLVFAKSYGFIKNVDTSSIGNFYKNDYLKSNLNNKPVVLDVNQNNQNNYLLQLFFNYQTSVIFSILLLFVDICLLAWCFWIYSRTKFIATIKNFRYLRIIYYLIFLSLGLFIGDLKINSLFDSSLVLSVFLSFIFAGLFCIWENDEVDEEIDKISNKNRPLPKGEVSREEWSLMKYVFLGISLFFAFLGGLYLFLLDIIFISIYHIYSAPPLRLKRIPFLSSFLIALNAVVVVLIGYFTSSKAQNLLEFPKQILFFVLIAFFLVENIKNIKDIKGDLENGIKTIPNILGEEMSKLFFGFLSAIAILVVPFIFYLSLKAIIISVVFSMIIFLVVNRKKWDEKKVFITYFFFVIFFVLTILSPF